MAGHGNPPIRRDIASDSRVPAGAGGRGSHSCPTAAALGDASQAATKRVDHPGESQEHGPVLRDGAGAGRWPLQP